MAGRGRASRRLSIVTALFNLLIVFYPGIPSLYWANRSTNSSHWVSLSLNDTYPPEPLTQLVTLHSHSDGGGSHMIR